MDEAHIGLLTYNTRDLVLENLESLIESGVSPEALLVWDNASSDGTAEALAARFPAVRSQVSERNLGYAEGMNRIVEALGGDHVILLTADCFTTQGAIERLRAVLVSDSTIAICGGRLISARTGRIESEGGTISFPLGIAIARNKHQEADLLVTGPTDVAYVDGAFLALNRGAFSQIGGFDSHFFAYHEEVDLCWRARQKGYRVVCDPAAQATHRTYGSFGSLPSQRWRLAERNRIGSNVKNLNPLNLAVAALAEVGYAVVVFLLVPALGPKGYARAYGRALMDVARGRLHLRKARRAVQDARRVSDDTVLASHTRLGPKALFAELNVQRELFYSGDGSDQAHS
ncbi:MAG: glycosyltransferase family 2 protein [Thermoplasmata archaeon]